MNKIERDNKRTTTTTTMSTVMMMMMTTMKMSVAAKTAVEYIMFLKENNLFASACASRLHKSLVVHDSLQKV